MSKPKRRNPLLAHHFEIVAETVIATQLSSLAMLSRGKEDFVLPFKPSNSAEKRNLLKLLRAMTQALGIEEVVLVIEAWVVLTEAPRDQPVDVVAERAKLPDNLADAPGRKEILVIQIERVGEPLRIQTYNIQRDSTGKICALPRILSNRWFMESNMWILADPNAVEMVS